MNIANRESGVEDPGRRSLLRMMAGVAVVSILDTAFRPKIVSANPRREAAVRLSEKTINVTRDSSGREIGRVETVDDGNEYLLSPTQERGSQRAQRVLLRIGTDGIARERIKIMHKGGNHSWKDGGNTFVFNGNQDTEAPVYNSCDPNPCVATRSDEYKPGMNIDIYRVKKGGALEYFLTFPTAFDCNPREQRVTDTITEIRNLPVQPTPTPEQTPSPAPRPVPAPVQIPRSSTEATLSEEFGSAAVVSKGELGRIEYE